MTKRKILVVGGGIAGMSLAPRLISSADEVTLIEATPAAPYHSTGRSAALADPIYVPNPAVARLTRAAHGFLTNPPGVYGRILQPRGSLHVAGGDFGDAQALLDLKLLCEASGVETEVLEADRLRERYPHLRPEHAFAAIEASPGAAFDIDVDALYQGARATFVHLGGVVRLGEGLIEGRRVGGTWRVRTDNDVLTADVVVIAAGAWADDVARRMGVKPLGLTPMRRTLVSAKINASWWPAPETLTPFTFWVGSQEDLYFRLSRGGEVWISPADETPIEACDVAPEEIDVAEAIARFEERTRFKVAPRLNRTWAGLRTFASDRKPVIGWDPGAPGVFWSAAYGGFGIESSPAAADCAADLFHGKRSAGYLYDLFKVDPSQFRPERLLRQPAR